MKYLGHLRKNEEINVENLEQYEYMLIPPGEVEFTDTAPEALPEETVTELTDDIQYQNAARAGEPVEGSWDLENSNLKDSILSYLSEVYGDELIASDNPERREVEFVNATLDREGNVELTTQLYLSGEHSGETGNREVYPSTAGWITVEGEFDGMEDYPSGVVDQF